MNSPASFPCTLRHPRVPSGGVLQPWLRYTSLSLVYALPPEAHYTACQLMERGSHGTVCQCRRARPGMVRYHPLPQDNAYKSASGNPAAGPIFAWAVMRRCLREPRPTNGPHHGLSYVINSRATAMISRRGGGGGGRGGEKEHPRNTLPTPKNRTQIRTRTYSKRKREDGRHEMEQRIATVSRHHIPSPPFIPFI